MRPAALPRSSACEEGRKVRPPARVPLSGGPGTRPLPAETVTPRRRAAPPQRGLPWRPLRLSSPSGRPERRPTEGGTGTVSRAEPAPRLGRAGREGNRARPRFQPASTEDRGEEPPPRSGRVPSFRRGGRDADGLRPDDPRPKARHTCLPGFPSVQRLAADRPEPAISSGKTGRRRPAGRGDPACRRAARLSRRQAARPLQEVAPRAVRSLRVPLGRKQPPHPPHVWRSRGPFPTGSRRRDASARRGGGPRGRRTRRRRAAGVRASLPRLPSPVRVGGDPRAALGRSGGRRRQGGGPAPRLVRPSWPQNPVGRYSKATCRIRR
jgi:hypothetical protein